tara:strand:- start:1211 stop:1966 length:756 start_codon:yes stop_codon:yes gene_type:complete
MNIIISIVSHGHGSLVSENTHLLAISMLTGVSIVVKDNLGEQILKEYCAINDFIYIDEMKGLGFGANNNYIFNNYLQLETDYFIVMNPDVYISVNEFSKLYRYLILSNRPLVTIDLYRDFDFDVRDNSIRKFPRFSDFFYSFLLSKNSSIYDRKSLIENPDWCAGSFMCFSVGLFSKLNGFDENFFMYCEDLDICKRSKDKGYPLYYFSGSKAVHTAAFNNRSMFSIHFYWHLSSVVRYLIKQHFTVGDRK